MTTTQITSSMAKYEIVLFGNLILEILENMSKKLRLINNRTSMELEFNTVEIYFKYAWHSYGFINS